VPEGTKHKRLIVQNAGCIIALRIVRKAQLHGNFVQSIVCKVLRQPSMNEGGQPNDGG
jgi:hypothetical protein